MDERSRSPVALVHVILTDSADTTRTYAGLTAEDGTFALRNLRFGAYRVEAGRIGYQPLRTKVIVTGWMDLGTLSLRPLALPLKGIVVRGSPPPAVQKADTTEFNAGAVKVNPDADAGDLIEKMPGVTIANGTIKSNGETVQQVLVDGREYFGQDPLIAIHNLPAEVIDKIQVFDKLSDQAELTGFDDGQSIKTMNLVLRPDRRNGRFGKLYAGGGGDGRYLTGGNSNVMKGATRLSVIGLANNVNQQNFSTQDLLGVMSGSGRRGGFGGGPNGRRAGGGGRGARGGGRGFGPPGGGQGYGGGLGAGSFMVGQQNGLTSTLSMGANYGGDGWKGLLINQSYFFNRLGNDNNQLLSRVYTVPVDSILSYRQDSHTPNVNYNNRYQGRFLDTLSTSTTIIEQPRFYFQNNHSTSTMTASNMDFAGSTINQAVTGTSGSTSGSDLSNHLVLRHRFQKQGRSISVDLGNGYTSKSGSAVLTSQSTYQAGNAAVLDTLNQRTTVNSTTNSISARMAYTEPLGESGLLEFTYFPSLTSSRSDNRAFEQDPQTQAFTLPDTSLSNSFTSRNTAQNIGLGCFRRRGSVNLMANISYQASTLSQRQTSPGVARVDRSFRDLLPFVMLNYGLRGQRNLRVSFNTQTRVPSINQVQNLIDNSNPLSFTMGNPDLKESRFQTVLGRYSVTNPATGRSVFLLFSAQRAQDYLANSTFTASRDTVLAPGDTLRAGSQLLRPVNLNGYWNLNSFVTYSRPVGLIKSVMNLNSGVTYTRTPGLINQLDNRADTYALSQGVVFSSNISESVDFTVSYTGSYNITHNSVQGTQDNDYYSHVAAIKCNLLGWNRLVLRNEMTHNYTTGLGSGNDQNVLLWNLGLGEKLLSNRRLEVRLTASDILNRGRSYNHTVTDAYVEDTRNLTLGRVVLVNLTYTLNSSEGPGQRGPGPRGPDEGGPDHHGHGGFDGGGHGWGPPE